PPDDFAWRWTPYHLAQAGDNAGLRRVLLDYETMTRRLEKVGVHRLVDDFGYLTDSDSRLIQGAIQLGLHCIARDPAQLAVQLHGRLASCKRSAIQTLLEDVRRRTKGPWLCPLLSNLTPPGGPLVRTFEGHTDGVNVVNVDHAGARAVSGSSDGTVRLWDLQRGIELAVLEGHTGYVRGVALLPDGRRIVSCSNDGTVRLWDLESRSQLWKLEGHHNVIYAMAVAADGLRALTAGSDGTLRVWDLENEAELQQLKPDQHVTAIAILPDGRRAVLGSSEGTLSIWNLDGQTE